MSLELLNNPLAGNFKDWDQPWENGNFQAKFPEFPKSQESINFPSSPVKYNFKQLTTKEIAERDFGNKPVVSSKNFKVFTDDPKTINEIKGTKEIKEVNLYNYRYTKTIDDIKVVLFACKNGVALLQRYLEVQPQPDELVLFLETKGDLDFNTVMHIKAGTDLTHRKDLPFKEIINFSNLHKVEISGAKIKNLIEKEIYKDKHSFMRWFFTITNALAGNLFSFFTKDIVKEGAEGFKTIANKIQEFRIDENRWNPEPKEGKYDPIFIPDEYAKRMEKAYLHQEYDNPNQNVKAQRNIITQISKNFFDELSQAKSFALDTLKDAKQYLPTVLYNKLQSIVNYVFKQINSIEKAISDPFAALGRLIYKQQKMINAFLCGVYNSIIDIIAGIFSLIALIFEAVYTIKDVQDQIFIYAEMLVELFENMAEGILNFNFAEFFFNWISFEIKTLFNLINFLEKLGKTSLEKYAYYYGYIVGIVIDIIVETLLTGGVAAVEKLLQSVEAFLRNPLQKIAKAIEKSAIFVENVLQKIINFLDFLAKKLKKGAGDLFNELKKIINEIFGFGEEVGDHALTPSEKRYKDKLKAKQERIERRKKGKKYRVAEGAGSTKYITKEKFLDKTATLGEVSRLEAEIINETYEFGVFVDETGKPISHKFTDNNTKGVDIPTMVDLSTRKYRRIFTHNHPESSPLSAFDIMTFVKGDMDELRAVCKNGDVYALIKKGNLPSEIDDWIIIKKRVINRVKTENAELIEKARLSPIGSSERFLYDQKIADTWIEELGELIEYVKYQ